MKRIASLLLVLVIALCGCSDVEEGIVLEEDNIVAEEQDAFVYDADSGEDVPGEEIPLETLVTNEDKQEPLKDAASSVDEMESVSVTVYRTKTGKKYHRSGCRHLKSKIETTVDEAKAMGLKPCSVCSPPQ